MSVTINRKPTRWCESKTIDYFCVCWAFNLPWEILQRGEKPGGTFGVDNFIHCRKHSQFSPGWREHAPVSTETERGVLEGWSKGFSLDSIYSNVAKIRDLVFLSWIRVSQGLTFRRLLISLRETKIAPALSAIQVMDDIGGAPSIKSSCPSIIASSSLSKITKFEGAGEYWITSFILWKEWKAQANDKFEASEMPIPQLVVLREDRGGSLQGFEEISRIIAGRWWSKETDNGIIESQVIFWSERDFPSSDIQEIRWSRKIREPLEIHEA